MSIRHGPARCTGSLYQALHSSSVLDDDDADDADDDDDDDEVLLVTSVTVRSLRRGSSENMLTNASSSVFITNLRDTHAPTTITRLLVCER